MSQATKICPGCLHDFPATPEFFYIDNSRADGLSTSCWPCRKKAQRAYRGRKSQKMRILPSPSVRSTEPPGFRGPSLAERIARADMIRDNTERPTVSSGGWMTAGSVASWATGSFTNDQLRVLESYMRLLEAHIEIFEEHLAPLMPKLVMDNFRALVAARAKAKLDDERRLAVPTELEAALG